MSKITPRAQSLLQHIKWLTEDFESKFYSAGISYARHRNAVLIPLSNQVTPSTIAAMYTHHGTLSMLYPLVDVYNFALISAACAFALASASLLTVTLPLFSPFPKNMTSTVRSSLYLLEYGAGNVSNAVTIS